MKQITELDFSGIRQRLADKKKSYKWNKTRIKTAEQGYKKLLGELFKNPSGSIKHLLTDDIDEFWHLHILDTKQYADDCKKIFGKFIHHVPSYSKHYMKESHADECGTCDGGTCDGCDSQ